MSEGVVELVRAEFIKLFDIQEEEKEELFDKFSDLEKLRLIFEEH